jgi:primosomal protein N''
LPARQYEPALDAIEQKHAKLLLESSAMADRALAQMQFICGLGETQVPRRNREDPKRVKRGQTRHISQPPDVRIRLMNSAKNSRLSRGRGAG